MNWVNKPGQPGSPSQNLLNCCKTSTGQILFLLPNQQHQTHPITATTYFVVDAEVELLVAGSNRHFGIRIWIISSAWFEDDVAVVFEPSYQPQILYSTPHTCTSNTKQLVNYTLNLQIVVAIAENLSTIIVSWEISRNLFQCVQKFPENLKHFLSVPVHCADENISHSWHIVTFICCKTGQNGYH